MKKPDLSIPSIQLSSIIKIGLLGLLILIPYYSALSYLVGLWKGDDYTYCYLIPLISLYLIWDKREELAKEESAPTWKGLTLVVIAIVLFFVGELGGEYYSMHISLWLLIIGLCWLLMGSQKLKVLAFPLAILLTAIPFPYFVYANLTLRLKLISSQLGVWMLHRFGFSAYREGNVIDLGFTQLQVVDACSGLRFLIPLFVLSIIMVYFYRVSIWKKIIIVLSTIPLTVFTNSLRIAMTGVLYKSWGAAAAEGFFHGFSGWFIFMFSFAILILEMWVLNKIVPGDVRGGEAPDGAQPAPAPAGQKVPVHVPVSLLATLKQPQYLTALILLLLTSAIAYGIEFREKIPSSKPFSQFPLKVGEWSGTRQYMEQFFIKELDLTDYVMVDYQNAAKPVNFYVAWYESQRKGESIHSPESCLPGGGWIFSQAGKSTISLSNGKTLPVNRAIMEKSGYRQISYYWFPMRGRVLTSTWEVKLYTFWDALTRQRTDGALVRVITPVTAGETPEDAEKRLQAFTKEIVPILDQYLPR